MKSIIPCNSPVNLLNPLCRDLVSWFGCIGQISHFGAQGGLQFPDLLSPQNSAIAFRVGSTKAQVVEVYPEVGGYCSISNDTITGGSTYNTGNYFTAPVRPKHTTTGAMTALVTFSIAAIGGSSSPGIFSHYVTTDGTGSVNRRKWTLVFRDGTTDVVGVVISSNGSAVTAADSTRTFTAGTTFYSLAFVYTPSESLKLFIDGKLETTNTTSIPSSLYNNTVDNLSVGTQGANTELTSFPGRIGSALYWKRALTDFEIMQVHREWKQAWPTMLRRLKWPQQYATATTIFTGSAGLVLGNIESSISATHTTPTYTSSAALTLGNIESVSSATFTPITYTGSAALTLGKLNMEAFLTFTSNTFTATSDLTLGNIESVISSTFTSPVYTATSDLTIGNIESVSTALFAAIVRSATADLTLGNIESVSTATFTVPTYTATTSLVLGNVESVSTATFLPPVFTATAALTLGNIETTASATFAGISYTATVIVLLGGIELVGESVFLAAPPIAWHYYKYLLSGNVYEYYV